MNLCLNFIMKISNEKQFITDLCSSSTEHNIPYDKELKEKLLSFKSTSNIKLYYPELLAQIISLTPFVPSGTRHEITERIYCIINDIHSLPKCPICETGDCNFKDKKSGYGVTCSSKCVAIRNNMARTKLTDRKGSPRKQEICLICNNGFVRGDMGI